MMICRPGPWLAGRLIELNQIYFMNKKQFIMSSLVFDRLRPFAGPTGLLRTDRRQMLLPLGFWMAVVLFLFCGPLLRLVDPVAAVVDLGVLSLLLLGLLAGVGFIAASSWLLGLLWPVFRDFRNHHFEPIFKSLIPWQKIVIYLGCFFLLLYAFVACLAAVF